MSKYDALDRQELIQVLERIEAFATETAELWEGRVATHGGDCHLRHAGCLAQAVLDEGAMAVAVKNIATGLSGQRGGE